jgi:hypothetical protein
MIVADRLWSRVERGEHCWLWRGTQVRGGYGRVKVDGRQVLAHRLAYALTHGSIPDGLVVHHECRTRLCVNPAHLRACSQRENVHADGSLAVAHAHALKTACIRGHPFTPENTYRGVDGRRRQCRTCQDVAIARYRAMRRERDAARP